MTTSFTGTGWTPGERMLHRRRRIPSCRPARRRPDRDAAAGRSRRTPTTGVDPRNTRCRRTRARHRPCRSGCGHPGNRTGPAPPRREFRAHRPPHVTTRQRECPPVEGYAGDLFRVGHIAVEPESGLANGLEVCGVGRERVLEVVASCLNFFLDCALPHEGTAVHVSIVTTDLDVGVVAGSLRESSAGRPA